MCCTVYSIISINSYGKNNDAEYRNCSTVMCLAKIINELRLDLTFASVLSRYFCD